MSAFYKGNCELVGVTSQVVFTEPFVIGAENNLWTKRSPKLQQDVHEIQNDEELLWIVQQLKNKFLNSNEALLHGDLHTGSIMVDSKRSVVFDTEFSFVGPRAFDVSE